MTGEPDETGTASAPDTTPPQAPPASVDEGNIRDADHFQDVKSASGEAWAEDPINSQILAQIEAIRAAAERDLAALGDATLALTMNQAAGLAMLNAVQAQQSDAALATAMLGRTVVHLRAIAVETEGSNAHG